MIPASRMVKIPLYSRCREAEGMEWKEHYQRLRNEEWDSDTLDIGVLKEGPASWFNKEVVCVAFQKLKDGKAAGASVIIA